MPHSLKRFRPRAFGSWVLLGCVWELASLKLTAFGGRGINFAMLCYRIAPLVFPLTSPVGPLQRTALSKKLINQLFFVFIALCLQVNLRHRLQKQKVSNFRHLFASFVLCGEGGIRRSSLWLVLARIPYQRRLQAEP